MSDNNMSNDAEDYGLAPSTITQSDTTPSDTPNTSPDHATPRSGSTRSDDPRDRPTERSFGLLMSIVGQPVPVAVIVIVLLVTAVLMTVVEFNVGQAESGNLGMV